MIESQFRGENMPSMSLRLDTGKSELYAGAFQPVSQPAENKLRKEIST